MYLPIDRARLRKPPRDTCLIINGERKPGTTLLLAHLAYLVYETGSCVFFGAPALPVIGPILRRPRFQKWADLVADFGLFFMRTGECWTDKLLFKEPPDVIDVDDAQRFFAVTAGSWKDLPGSSCPFPKPYWWKDEFNNINPPGAQGPVPRYVPVAEKEGAASNST